MKIIIKNKYLILICLVIGIASFFYFQDSIVNIGAVEEISEEQDVVMELQDEKVCVEICDGSTYGVLMEEAGVSASEANTIYEASIDIYDLAKIRLGRDLELFFESDTENLKKLVYKIDSEEEIVVKNLKYFDENKNIDEWQAEIKEIDYEVRIVQKSGEVETSMYEAALKNNIDERAIIELANAFQWSIDFAMDPREGDKFEFVYEERYLDDEYKMPGKVLAGVYINDGEKFQVYYFEENEKNIGYFDEKGNSVQKMFLKAPVEFKYISSGYTTGNRVVMEIGLSGPHRAIDYAAAIGTPIRAVGDGIITFAGWSSAGYGYLTSIRHNGTYSTNYAHQSRIAVKRGQKVKQGEVIGYVGSTGYSTGPHLHYEMVKNGVKINSQKEVLPPGKAIEEENIDRYFEKIKKWQEILKIN
jgi:murein DD-endopeptidase MepM/ murein hydrolase activator NlpD